MQSLKFLGAASALVLAFASGNAYSQHAPAGTEINNTASVNYTIGSVTSTANSNLVTVTVVEMIDVTVALQTASLATVSPGDTARVARYRVQNTGNGSELFRLVLNNAITTDNFDPIAATPAIYIDSGGTPATNGIFDGSDVVYVPGAESAMAPGDFIIVFVVNGIPASALDGQQGVSRLTAESRTGTGPAGTTFVGQGNGINGAVDAVIGVSTGADSADTTYQIAGVSVTATKTQTVVDDWGGARPVPGARINYSIAVSATGAGTATNVVFSDNIPVNTTYVPGSLALNSVAITDAADPANDGDYSAAPTPRVSVPLGSLNTAAGTKTITFTVTIN